jgi:hypothetical protein
MTGNEPTRRRHRTLHGPLQFVFTLRTAGCALESWFWTAATWRRVKAFPSVVMATRRCGRRDGCLLQKVYMQQSVLLVPRYRGAAFTCQRTVIKWSLKTGASRIQMQMVCVKGHNVQQVCWDVLVQWDVYCVSGTLFWVCRLCKHAYKSSETAILGFFPSPLARRPIVGQGFIIEAWRSHFDTPHSVGLLWTSDQPNAQTSFWQYTTLPRDRHPCPR